MSDNMRAALLMMASMAFFTFNDTLVKMTDNRVPLFQLLLVRGVLTTAFLGLLAWRMDALIVRVSRRDAGLIALRCIGEIGAAYFFLTALLHMPLANVTAILQMLPLTVTLGAALFFGEGLGWRRLLAILIGFGGMLLIVRPGPEGFNLFTIYAVTAVAFVTLRDLSTRKMSLKVPSMFVTLTASVSVLVFAFIGSFSVETVPLEVDLLAMITGSALFIMGAYLFSVMVMRVGEIAVVAPFRYTGLIWALLLGWLIFDDWPDAYTMAGVVIIVACGLFTFYRERNLSKQRS